MPAEQDQEISKIREQHASGKWPKFLESVSISGLRGWSGQTVKFNFPVCAVVGENGTGKSTFLKAAACAYEVERGKPLFPSDFFINTHWDRISGVRLSYSIRQGTSTSLYEIRKPTKRWIVPKERARRNILFYDISRTLPLDASAGYAKIARLAVNEISSKVLTQDGKDQLSFILGRNYIQARFVTSDVDHRREIGLLERDFGEISQFHQGAGEDATLDLMSSLQAIPDTSLLLIDEVEASLHPKAQRRLVRFLLKLSRQKRVQIIMSTHSPYVLQELPVEARILLLPGRESTNIVYGASAEFALSHLDENVHPEMLVFVEDREAQILLREILASDPQGIELLNRLAFVPVGPANVVSIMGDLSESNRLPYKSVAVLDGDQTNPNCMSLPGSDSPERVVFSDLKSKGWPCLPSRLGIGAGTLLTQIEEVMLEPQPHKWTTMIGDRVHKSSISVWEIMANQWCQSCLKTEDKNVLVHGIQESLDS
ncbi:ATP-dependent nuclease [Gloeobacter kilaueensis]|uniref:ATP-dependent endonuclease of the OLD family n=1 Tax=Gloeobacter kilaueensis (strain ATCC BAA-2537 / CCAP 1431/1 / ULC 316 / JS1) TaxID=1183438 RepID=U5QIL6_GLOK1|nr:ATP-binding protein [Gloeobacter kilaueensis]AGY57510.1 ATP-dependent endonuclease of the OLD family [Gloeobacter kilaueensis JS1]